jgi:hypothetical protein
MASLRELSIFFYFVHFIEPVFRQAGMRFLRIAKGKLILEFGFRKKSYN